MLGYPLEVKGAFLRDAKNVLLVTAPQDKQRHYTVDVIGVPTSPATSSPPVEPLAFDGFALYRITFAVVPGHAFVTRDGSQRGIPRGERLYLTGTPLAVARSTDDGTDLSIGGRTDVTGVPEIEMLATSDLHAGAPVHRISLLLPAGLYAWKAAHGVPDEWRDPPTTLEKVTKSLGTTNDATGVNVDPVTLTARNGVRYLGATISLDGTSTPVRRCCSSARTPTRFCEVVRPRRHLPHGRRRHLARSRRVHRRRASRGLRRRPARGAPRPPGRRHLAALTYLCAGARLRVAAHLLRRGDRRRRHPRPSPRRDAAANELALVETLPRFPAPHELVVRTAAQTPGAAYTLTIAGLTDDAGNTRHGHHRLDLTGDVPAVHSL